MPSIFLDRDSSSLIRWVYSVSYRRRGWMIQDSSFVPTIWKVYENSMLNILRGYRVNIAEAGCRLFNTGVNDAVWKGYDTEAASNTTNTLSATLYLLLINETGYLLSNKETLLVRDTLAGTLPGLYPLTCKYRGFPVILSRDCPDTFYLSHPSSIARILHAFTETFPKRTAPTVIPYVQCQQFCT